MPGNREIEKKLKDGIDAELGKHDREINVSSKIRSMLKQEGARLELESQLPDSLEYNQILAILIGRSENFRDRREDSKVRATIKD